MSVACVVLTDVTCFCPQTTIKVYARCLRPDIEYKTLSISFSSTSRDVVQSLLNKYRMRHRDPNLFYLTMEVAVRKADLIFIWVDARPAELQSCHPRGDSRFALQMRRGGLVKIYDSILMSGSQYKSLLISERTTVDELIQILLNCYNSKERVEQFSVYEVCKSEEYERKLHPDDCPLRVQQFWAPPRQLHFMLRRNPDCPRPRRKIGSLSPATNNCSSSTSTYRPSLHPSSLHTPAPYSSTATSSNQNRPPLCSQ
ncbi:hypothetical protein B566_EDAN005266 [Ephemera danica]|nr:hypothetical protein B566_EDAN005266 [Ephemera danica]